MRPAAKTASIPDVCIFCSTRIQLLSAHPTSKTQRRFLRSSSAIFRPPAAATPVRTEPRYESTHQDVPKQIPSLGGSWGKSSFAVELTPEEAALRKNIRQSQPSPLQRQPGIEPAGSSTTPLRQAKSNLNAQSSSRRSSPASEYVHRRLTLSWDCQICNTSNDRAGSNCQKCNRLRERPGAIQWRCTSCGWHNSRPGTRCTNCNSFNVDETRIGEVARQWKHVKRYGQDQESKPEPTHRRDIDNRNTQASGDRTNQRDQEDSIEQDRRRRIEQTKNGRFVGFQAVRSSQNAAVPSEKAQSRGFQGQRLSRERPLIGNVSRENNSASKKEEPQERPSHAQRQREIGHISRFSESPKYHQYEQDSADRPSPVFQSSHAPSQDFRLGKGTKSPVTDTVSKGGMTRWLPQFHTNDLARPAQKRQVQGNLTADADWLESMSLKRRQTDGYISNPGSRDPYAPSASVSPSPDGNAQADTVLGNYNNQNSDNPVHSVPETYAQPQSVIKHSDKFIRKDTRSRSRNNPSDSSVSSYLNHSSNSVTPYAYSQRSRKPRSTQDDYEDQAFEYDEDQDEARRRRREQRKKEKAAQKRALPPTPIYLPEFITVGNLAKVLRVRVDQFTRKMQDLGFEDTNNDHLLDAEVAGLIAAEFNFEPVIDTDSENQDLQARPPAEDKSVLPPRPPIVTIMGHVDHGKTTLLDYLRKSSVAASEHGGITQHIGAFSVSMPGGRLITFLDTPGHAAFLSMRQRGANVTDIVILVVAADDSVKPQTVEAIKHAKAANVPIIVAINKIDKEDKNVDRVKQDLARYGVEIEDYGGDTQAVYVSGKTGQGLSELEENVVALADILDMRAEVDGQAEGWILEAATKKAGRVATVLVRRGTIRQGDVIVAGSTWAKIRTLKNEAGVQVPHAGPGTPVEVDGWKDQPAAGDEVLQATSEQQAKSAIDYRLTRVEKEQMAADTSAINESRRLEQEKRESLANASTASPTTAPGVSPGDQLADSQPPLAPSDQEPASTTLPLVLKADVSGSVEACVNAVTGLGSASVNILILRSSVGPISESDITFAASSGAQIVSFNQTTTPEMYRLAERESVRLVEENIIYRLTDQVKARLEALLPEKVETRVTGEAEIAKPFEIGVGGRKKVLVAGCRVRNGVISRANKVKVLRGGEGGENVFDGSLSSLKNVKKDVTEMRKGSECGMAFEGWEGFKEGDMVQCYEEKRVKQTL